MWYSLEDVHLGEVRTGSTLRYRCERLSYVAYPRECICHVGQVYTVAVLVIDLYLCDTLGYE
jgi:hypothetical protein